MTTTQPRVNQPIAGALTDAIQKQVDQISGSIVNNILENVPIFINNSINYILSLLKEVPMFNRILAKVQGSDINKLFSIIFVLFVLSFIIPFWILVLMNLFLTFTLVFMSQLKCII